nr:cell division ATP-binding protein FtsE [Acaryochloris sp. IP29b_bin.148]
MSSTFQRLQAQVETPVNDHYTVQLRSVCKVYPQTRFSLLDINLTLRQGDFLFVTGASGAGKTTLMKLIYGAERADRGEVRVAGTNVGLLKGNRLSHLRRKLGVVFQDYKLIPRWTVSENVAFVLRSQGVPKAEIERRLQPTLKLVGLQKRADCFPSQLSGGEQQRASIARAIVGSPKLLLADEPTGNLDQDNALQVLEILKKLNSLGITVVITTHDMGLIQTVKAPVAQLDSGRLQVVPAEQVL